MPKTINEAPVSVLTVRSDGTANGTSAVFNVIADGFASADVDVNLAAAFATAAAAIGGGRTATEVRECVRQFFVAARAQARTAGGWT